MCCWVPHASIASLLWRARSTSWPLRTSIPGTWRTTARRPSCWPSWASTTVRTHVLVRIRVSMWLCGCACACVCGCACVLACVCACVRACVRVLSPANYPIPAGLPGQALWRARILCSCLSGGIGRAQGRGACAPLRTCCQGASHCFCCSHLALLAAATACCSYCCRRRSRHCSLSPLLATAIACCRRLLIVRSVCALVEGAAAAAVFHLRCPC